MGEPIFSFTMRFGLALFGSVQLEYRSFGIRYIWYLPASVVHCINAHPRLYVLVSYTSVSYSYGVVDSPIIRIGKALHGAKVTQTNYPIHVANSPPKPFVQPIRKRQQSTER